MIRSPENHVHSPANPFRSSVNMIPIVVNMIHTSANIIPDYDERFIIAKTLVRSPANLIRNYQ